MSLSDSAYLSAKPALTLYSTAGCHLCEQAEAVLQSLSLNWVVVDIASSDQLIEQYGVRIPVLLAEAASDDLGWPFSADDVRHYLQTNAQDAPG